MFEPKVVNSRAAMLDAAAAPIKEVRGILLRTECVRELVMLPFC